MKIINILEVKKQCKLLLEKIEEVENSDTNKDKFTDTKGNVTTYGSKETGQLKRTSMDLTRSLSKMRNNIY